MSKSFRSLRVAGTAAAVAAAASLVAWAESGGAGRTETRTYEVTDVVGAIRVDSEGGRIDVVARAGRGVRVTEVVRYRTRKPTPTHTLRGAELRFTAGCADVIDQCGVDYRIEMPAEVTTHADSGGGEIRATALSGPIDVLSGGGMVHGDGIAAASFVARTGGGAVDVTFAASPMNVGVQSGGGSVTLRLTPDRYAISTSAGGGSSTIAVPADGTSRRKINVTSGGGDIVISA